MLNALPYNWKYWQSLNLAVWPQTDHTKMLAPRRISEGPLDVHPTQSAIVVNYVVEAVVISEYGEPMVADRKECTKV